MRKILKKKKIKFPKMNLRNLNVRRKMLIISLTSVIFLILIGGVGFYYLQTSNTKISSMYKDHLLAITYVEEVKSSYNMSDANLFELMIPNKDSGRNDELKKEIQDKMTNLHKNIDLYQKIKLNDDEQQLLSDLMDNVTRAEGLRKDIIDMTKSDKTNTAYMLYNMSLSPLNEDIKQNLTDITNYEINASKELNNKNNKDFILAREIIFVSILFALVFGVLFSNFIALSIVKPLKNILEYVEKLSKGDLSIQTLSETKKVKFYEDEIGKLGHAIMDMRQSFWDLISNLSSSTEYVAASSEELTANAEQSSLGVDGIASSVTVIAEATENQLRTVMETSEIIHEIAQEIQLAAISTEETTKAADRTLEATINGDKAINKSKEQMDNIDKTVSSLESVIKKLDERSMEIGEIVGSIASIAQQTNLLALNAAIEAARAGESGRGFSVVAEEVRKLAEESQGSTKKIATLISLIQNDTNEAVVSMEEGSNQVKIGMEVVSKAGDAFENISSMVKAITAQVQEVASANNKISGESDKLVRSINKVDEISKEVTDQSQNISASVEEQSASIQEITSSSESLSKIAEELQSQACKFTL